MRIDYVVLIATTFLAATDMTSGTPASQLMTPPELANPVSAFADNHNGKRLLRTGTTEDEDDEERAVTRLKIPALEKAVQASKNPRVQNWMKEGLEVDDVFLVLNLDRVKGNIFASSKFKTWVKFATTLDKQNSGEAMIHPLIRKYGEVGLAKLLQRTKRGSTRADSEKLQRVQFEFWFKEGMGPHYMLRTFFKSNDEADIGELGRSILSQYRTHLNKNHPNWSNNIY
ncbi:hypothetical protein JG688_00009469 [Phytophthora aleatoria]|uniref:RxLR effector protein n=1 Tax=Phytophthora aleatoria TaxID=2496075 RepID=A0A8J5IG62_9STRA|nr:hypothetical protein JG688_00009469 [Phytophthora aleatoria]